MKYYHILPIIILLSLSSCSALKEAEREIADQKEKISELEKEIAYAEKRIPSSTETDRIKHIVFFKLIDGEDRKSFKHLFYLLKELEGIEYVSNFKVCEKMEDSYSEYARTDYDLSMYMTFGSEAHLQKYQKHEIHQKVKEASMKYISELWSYDISTL